MKRPDLWHFWAREDYCIWNNALALCWNPDDEKFGFHSFSDFGHPAFGDLLFTNNHSFSSLMNALPLLSFFLKLIRQFLSRLLNIFLRSFLHFFLSFLYISFCLTYFLSFDLPTFILISFLRNNFTQLKRCVKFFWNQVALKSNK